MSDLKRCGFRKWLSCLFFFLSVPWEALLHKQSSPTHSKVAISGSQFQLLLFTYKLGLPVSNWYCSKACRHWNVNALTISSCSKRGRMSFPHRELESHLKPTIVERSTVNFLLNQWGFFFPRSTLPHNLLQLQWLRHASPKSSDVVVLCTTLKSMEVRNIEIIPIE